MSLKSSAQIAPSFFTTDDASVPNLSVLGKTFKGLDTKNCRDDSEFLTIIKQLEYILTTKASSSQARLLNAEEQTNAKKWALALCLRCEKPVTRKRRNKLVKQLIETVKKGKLEPPFDVDPHNLKNHPQN